MRTTSGNNEATDEVTYTPLASADHAAHQLRNATSMQDTADYDSLRAAMDAEYYWRGVTETFRIADESFRAVAAATGDRQDISAHVMARAADWVGTIELAAEGTRLYGALVAYTQGVGDGYAAIELWAHGVRTMHY
ncbi:hypothetical protein [Rhodococcus chondri]|uniref:Uncharacterized protein n=1 Tax=Rhodococcus chondri TaxID=3065941 RepID=A0ABU7JYS6_9NOCA|nr:hypothetical protein [Rhodococcus sp. CC-R104]MEE2035162.1 hypothetical protein [Rhodococcus sp. CC-R104]